MQKTYWWRVPSLLLGCIIFGWGYLVTTINSLDSWYSAYIDPSMFLSLSLIFVSIALFFFSDSVFLKWLRFAIVWFTLAAIFILLAPEYQGGWLGIGPEKESVSIWMSVLFVILSFGKIIWESRKAERSHGAV